MSGSTEFILHAHAERVAAVFNRLRLSPIMLVRSLDALRDEFDEQAWDIEDGRIVVRYRRRRSRQRSGVTPLAHGKVTPRA